MRWLVLAVSIAGICWGYLSAEETFYWWDYGGYHNWSVKIAGNLQTSPRETIKTFWDSLDKDYSQLPLLPAIAFILIFGESRLVYILAVALVYFLPFGLMLGAIATQLLSHYPHRRVFWSTIAIIILTPVAWSPIFRGFPDMGAAFLVASAWFFYFRGKLSTQASLSQQILTSMVPAGILLGFAMLFRRHFAYDIVAFAAAISINAAIELFISWRQSRKQARQSVYQQATQILAVGLSTILPIAVLAGEFLQKIVERNYRELYASYSLPLSDSLFHYTTAYGWGIFMLAVLGFSGGIVTKNIQPVVARTLAIALTVSILEWVVYLRYDNIQYTLHLTPYMILGLVACFGTAWQILPQISKQVFVGIATIFVTVNAMVGFFPVVDNPTATPLGVATHRWLHPLFSATHAPIRRQDMDEIAKLVRFLRDRTSPQDPIYVAASSHLFNRSLLYNAELALYDRDETQLQIPRIPQVDSRDIFTGKELFNAQVVLIVNPIQYHLLPSEQDVIRVVVDAFTENWDFSQDFRRLSLMFSLQNGATVQVYQRVRSTSQEVAAKTLARMRREGEEWEEWEEGEEGEKTTRSFRLRLDHRVFAVRIWYGKNRRVYNYIGGF
ncbi:hypothetical protein [Geitlerinema sp. PCC 9228]|uniref:hypothetical protein n=1 Tax=Geitlerinema sp. PCC 9228 TaxID=111611 RepID=UPI00111493D1|nr:hypothetical protein [Geitlerinema sp. PCC 9228]